MPSLKLTSKHCLQILLAETDQHISQKGTHTMVHCSSPIRAIGKQSVPTLVLRYFESLPRHGEDSQWKNARTEKCSASCWRR